MAKSIDDTNPGFGGFPLSDAPSAPLCTVRPLTQISICAFTPITPQPTNELL